MRNEAIKFTERLGVEFKEELLPYYERALELKRERGLAIVEKDRLIRLNEEYKFFRVGFDAVLEASDLVAKNDDLILYNYVIYLIITDGIKAIEKIIPTPAGVSTETDFAPAFGILYCIESAVEILKKRGLPIEIISDSLSGIESEMLAYYDMHARYGMRDYVGWYTYFLLGEIIRVGRLQYQFMKFGTAVKVYERDGDIAIMANNRDAHKNGLFFGATGNQDEDGKFFAELKIDGDRVTGYRADRYGELSTTPETIEGYREVLKEGDNVVAIHITNGEPFHIDTVRESFRMMDEVIEKYYSDLDIKAYHGYSWVFNKHLRDIMGRDTNLTLLADMFDLYPTSGGHHGIFEYVFKRPGSTPIEELPEDTSMQRAIKKYLLDGNVFCEMACIRMIK